MDFYINYCNELLEKVIFNLDRVWIKFQIYMTQLENIS